MQKIFIPIITLLLFCATNAQTAIIKDPDGYCNIRQQANSQSKVLDTLSNGSIVFAYEDEAEANWLPIDYRKGGDTRSGFVHKSRIIFLSHFTKFNKVFINDSLLKLQLDTIRITITKGNLNPKSRKIQYGKELGQQTYLKTIDNKFPWGTDGNIPKKEYKAIQLKTGKNILNFPANNFKDLFEPNLDLTSAYMDKATNKFYIEANNSDGAGSYVVIWTIKDLKIIGRTTYIPF